MIFVLIKIKNISYSWNRDTKFSHTKKVKKTFLSCLSKAYFPVAQRYRLLKEFIDPIKSMIASNKESFSSVRVQFHVKNQ